MPFIIILLICIFDREIYPLYFNLNGPRIMVTFLIFSVLLLFFISRNYVYNDILYVKYDSEKAYEKVQYTLPKMLQHFSEKGYSFDTIKI